MKPDLANSFKIGDQDYRFEVISPLYTKRPQQFLNEKPFRWEDRIHRTVKITRLSDARSWTGATDLKAWHVKHLSLYLQSWLVDCFAQWDPNAIPEGFEIPQQGVPPDPLKHHCPEFPVVAAMAEGSSKNDEVVDAASEGSFPASDPPEWTDLRVA